jgi:indole-3-glycerol phosphate synthase
LADILDKIITQTKIDLEQRKAVMSLDMLGMSLSYNPYVPRDVKPFLSTNEQDPYRIIAEVKKASPSKGVIREDFNPVEIAQGYERGGANSLSVLTEPHFFQGDLEYLTQIRRYVSIPLLRKDFIVDRYQLVEALVYGADYVLLIAKALSRKELKKLLEDAWHLGLEVLVEIHDKSDLTKAIFAGANIIGINHRNLETFEMDMELSAKLVPLIPNGKIIVSESGLIEHEQLVELNKQGVDAFLIGEHFMRQQSVEEAVKKIKGSL